MTIEFEIVPPPGAATPATAAPVGVSPPPDIPPGWELATQTLRRIKIPGSSTSTIKPTATVVSATVASTFAPMIIYLFSSLNHPLPAEVALALPTMFAFLGGWFHPAGRT
jgi:hypothetical protein